MKKEHASKVSKGEKALTVADLEQVGGGFFGFDDFGWGGGEGMETGMAETIRNRNEPRDMSYGGDNGFGDNGFGDFGGGDFYW
jgi:hypothetical protein